MFEFDQDIGEGVVMTYRVRGQSKEEAEAYLVKLLQSGKITEEGGLLYEVLRNGELIFRAG